MQTTVVNVRLTGNFDVYIGRPSKWGNPFSIGARHPKHEYPITRNAAITLYREWLRQQPDLLRALPELRGKRLGCYCKPQACHGDVLAELAEGPLGGPRTAGVDCRCSGCTDD